MVKPRTFCRCRDCIRLKEENKAFKVEKYAQLPTLLENRQAYFVLSFDSWFIKITEVRDRMFDLNASTGSQNQQEKDVLETG
jgi:hypothetical protein